MTPLTKTLKRLLNIDGRDYVIALSPQTLTIVPKGKRKGIELKWDELVSGEAALATALRATVGRITKSGSPTHRHTSRTS